MYKKNNDYNFYQKKDTISIEYSDGSQTEDELYQLLSSIKDKSVWSEELKSLIKDWPTEYHFSRRRHCLLRPLGIQPGDRVLELGCGCGAITRYLGECGAIVDAVEGTVSRARIAGERCKDLPNVKIHVDNFLDYISDKKYDWVLFIGVLEYAPLFSDSTDAIKSYIDIASRYLDKCGQLVIAIENKLGLKYFNGCGEDHLNEVNFGIENRYHKKTPITFGKNELKNILAQNGYAVNDFFYPFPDYKIPSFIIHETGFIDSIFDSSELLKGCYSRDYTGKTGRVFEESLVWPELVHNGIAADLANSFLIVASFTKAHENSNYKKLPLASYFNTERIKKYVTETIFYRENNEVFVRKRKIIPRIEYIDQSSIFLNEITQKYTPGNSFHDSIEIEWNKTKDYNVFIKFYRDWVKFLLKFLDEHKSLPGCYIDLTPFNIKLSDTEYFIFDQEWEVRENIPFHWVLFRGIYWSLVDLKTIHPLQIEPVDIINQVVKPLNISFTDGMLTDAIDRESSFLCSVTGMDFNFMSIIEKNPERVVDLHYKQLNIISSLRDELVRQTDLIQELSQINAEYEKVVQSKNDSFIVRIAKKFGDYLK